MEEDDNENSQIDEAFYSNDQLLELTAKQLHLYQYKCIGLLIFKRMIHSILKDGYGTAFVIGPKLICTVAHNIYHRKTKQLSTNLIFYPGIHDSSYQKPENGIKVTSYYFPDEFKTFAKGYRPFDYAIMQLESPVEFKSYIKFAINLKQGSRNLQIYGYNNSSVFPARKFAIQKGMEKEDSLVKIQDNISILHKVSTDHGNSGSPIMTRINGELVAIGIHQGLEQYKRIKKKDQLNNMGRLIEDKLIKNLIIWIKKLKDSSGIKFVVEKELEMKSIQWLTNGIEREEEIKSRDIQIINLKKVVLKQIIHQKFNFPQDIDSQIMINQINSYKLEDFNSKLKQIKLMKQQMNQQLNNLAKLQQKMQEIQVAKHPFQQQSGHNWNSTAKHASKFNITQRKIELKNQDQNNFYEMISLPINRGQDYCAKLKLCYGPNQMSLIVGMVTKDRIQENPYITHTQVISYINDPKECKGYIYANRQQIGQILTDQFVKENGILEVRIAKNSDCVSFRKSLVETSFNMGESFRQKQLYLYAGMSQKGASVTFC